MSKRNWASIQLILLIIYIIATQTSELMSDIISPIFSGVAGYIIFHSISKQKRKKANWIVLGLIPASWALVDIIWFVFAQLLHLDPNEYAVFTVLYIVPNILLTAAVMAYFFRKVKHWHRMKMLLDVVVVFVVVLGITSGLVFSNMDFISIEMEEAVGILMYLVTDMVALIVILLLASSMNIRKTPNHIRVLFAGIFIYIFADLTYVYEALTDLYVANSFSDIMFMVAFLFFVFAVLLIDDQITETKMEGVLNEPENLMYTKVILYVALLPLILYLIKAINLAHFAIITVTVIVYQFIMSFVQRTFMAEAMLNEKQRLMQELEDVVVERTRLLQESNDALFLKSTTDNLTGLYNRDYFVEAIDQRISEEKEFAILYMDLDRFKVINDHHGHPMGDKVLRIIADRFMETKDSLCTFARVGGDEFGVIYDGTDSKALIDLCRKITGLLELPVEVDEFRFYVGISIGITRYPMDASSAKQLLQYSDIAMYHAKKDESVDKFVLYSVHLIDQIERRNHLELLLRNADFIKDFELYYQPKFDTVTRKLVGMEALIRWKHATEGMISPSEFIPIAEETGIILPLSDWVFETATRQINEWNTTYSQDLIVSMNVSPISFDSYEFIPNIIRLINKTGVKAEWLEFEITENSAMNSAAKIEELFVALSSTGVFISIDDFGTGYSSLSYIKRFDVDILKIARELVENIVEDQDTQVIVKAIIMMAKGMDLYIIAEGIETEEQLAVLADLGCDAIQGYLFGRPTQAEDFEDQYLKQR